MANAPAPKAEPNPAEQKIRATITALLKKATPDAQDAAKLKTLMNELKALKGDKNLD